MTEYLLLNISLKWRHTMYLKEYNGFREKKTSREAVFKHWARGAGGRDWRVGPGSPEDLHKSHRKTKHIVDLFSSKKCWQLFPFYFTYSCKTGLKGSPNFTTALCESMNQCNEFKGIKMFPNNLKIHKPI